MSASTHYNNDDRIVNSNNNDDATTNAGPNDGSRGYPKPIGPVKPPPKPTREGGESSDISCPGKKKEQDMDGDVNRGNDGGVNGEGVCEGEGECQ
ncbi:hypothetical protein N0V85_006730 [Neurospora sp. IMI 360204]|nr:hypothetical protein N0V85_006730 [Neurospora sp. IMI 360204]